MAEHSACHVNSRTAICDDCRVLVCCWCDESAAYNLDGDPACDDHLEMWMYITEEIETYA